MKKILWYLTPIWLGDLIYKTTEFLMGARFDENGKMLDFYFQKESPDKFTNWGGKKIE